MKKEENWTNVFFSHAFVCFMPCIFKFAETFIVTVSFYKNEFSVPSSKQIYRHEYTYINIFLVSVYPHTKQWCYCVKIIKENVLYFKCIMVLKVIDWSMFRKIYKDGIYLAYIDISLRVKWIFILILLIFLNPASLMIFYLALIHLFRRGK